MSDEDITLMDQTVAGIRVYIYKRSRRIVMWARAPRGRFGQTTLLTVAFDCARDVSYLHRGMEERAWWGSVNYVVTLQERFDKLNTKQRDALLAIIAMMDVSYIWIGGGP